MVLLFLIFLYLFIYLFIDVCVRMVCEYLHIDISPTSKDEGVCGVCFVVLSWPHLQDSCDPFLCVMGKTYQCVTRTSLCYICAHLQYT